jgi:O-acetyl-ADP-ribose deacetylase (regulator of RNase III)
MFHFFIIEESMEIDIRLADIAYPKSEAMVIPGNTVGLMTRGVAARISKTSLGAVKKEARKIAKESELKVGECFRTVPGRLKRRGLKNMYHAVIKRFPNDMTTIKIVTDSLEFSIKQAIKDKNKTVSICGLGIEDGDLEKNVIARIFLLTCNKYSDKIGIKIIDDDKDFISALEKLAEIEK